MRFLSVFVFFVLLSCGYQPSTSERGFHFVYRVSVWPIQEAGSSVRLWIPLPGSDPYQTISNLTITSPVEVSTHTEPVYQNSLAYVSATTPFPSGLWVDVAFDVLRREQSITAVSLSPDERDRFLAPGSMTPRDSRFDQIARTVLSPANTALENGRVLYNHVLDRMTYDKSGEGWGQGNAIYACDIGKGNCSDFHSFFNAVARTADIPSRFLIGFPIPENGHGSIDGYHCWAEFYVPERGWVPVDISEADKHPENSGFFFGHLDPNRVFFTMGRDVELVPPAAGGPVNFFIYPVLEINGKRSDNYTKTFTYRSLSE